MAKATAFWRVCVVLHYTNRWYWFPYWREWIV